MHQSTEIKYCMRYLSRQNASFYEDQIQHAIFKSTEWCIWTFSSVGSRSSKQARVSTSFRKEKALRFTARRPTQLTRSTLHCTSTTQLTPGRWMTLEYERLARFEMYLPGRRIHRTIRKNTWGTPIFCVNQPLNGQAKQRNKVKDGTLRCKTKAGSSQNMKEGEV